MQVATLEAELSRKSVFESRETPGRRDRATRCRAKKHSQTKRLEMKAKKQAPKKAPRHALRRTGVPWEGDTFLCTGEWSYFPACVRKLLKTPRHRVQESAAKIHPQGDDEEGMARRGWRIAIAVSGPPTSGGRGARSDGTRRAVMEGGGGVWAEQG